MMTDTTIPSKDSILEFFVEAANKHGFSLDVTLNVNGAVITGTTISAKEYFGTLSEKLEDGNDTAQSLSEQLAKAGETAETEAQNGQSGSADFIHLKNTKIFCGDNKATPSKGKILWRGKLDQIDGFFLGKVKEAKSESKK